MKSQTKLFRIFVIILLMIGGLILFYRMSGDLGQIKIVNPIFLIYSSVFISLSILVNGWLTKALLAHFRIRLDFHEYFGLSVVNTLGNIMTPLRGGVMANAVFLKKVYNFRMSDFAAMISATYIVAFQLCSLIGLFSCYYVWKHYGVFNLFIFLLFFLSLLFLGFVTLFSPTFSQTKFRIINRFLAAINEWEKIRKNKTLIFQIAFYTFLNIILMVFAGYFEFAALGINVSIGKLIFLSVFSTYALFISVTPSNFGVREAFLVYSGLIIGIPTMQVIVVSLIDRLITFIIALFLGIPYSNHLLKRANSGVK